MDFSKSSAAASTTLAMYAHIFLTIVKLFHESISCRKGGRTITFSVIKLSKFSLRGDCWRTSLRSNFWMIKEMSLKLFLIVFLIMINLNITEKLYLPPRAVFFKCLMSTVKWLSIHIFVNVSIQGFSPDGGRIASVAALNRESVAISATEPEAILKPKSLDILLDLYWQIIR